MLRVAVIESRRGELGGIRDVEDQVVIVQSRRFAVPPPHFVINTKRLWWASDRVPRGLDSCDARSRAGQGRVAVCFGCRDRLLLVAVGPIRVLKVDLRLAQALRQVSVNPSVDWRVLSRGVGDRRGFRRRQPVLCVPVEGLLSVRRLVFLEVQRCPPVALARFGGRWFQVVGVAR